MTKRTNRRAISTIIGSAVFLVLFVAGFTVFIFALEVSSERFSEQLSASFEQTLRGKESFTIAPSVDTSLELFIEVLNTGSVPLNIIRAYMVDTSDGTLFNYEINFQDAHIAPNESRAILANYVQGSGSSKTSITTDRTFDVKVVSELGTVVIQKMITPLDPFFVDLFTIPKNLGTGQDVTVAMMVYNRGNATIFNVQPANAATTMTSPQTAIQGVTDGPKPSSNIDLEPQESVLFTWEQTVIGAVGTLVTYTNGVTGLDPASGDTLTSTTDSDDVEFVPQAVSLLQQPELAFLISSPMGESGNSVIFGMNVINPTTTPITVSRVIFNAASNIGSDVTIFDVTGTCEGTEIEPNVANASWECPASGVLMWKADIGSAITIPGRDVQAFITEVDAGSIQSNTDDPATLLTGTAYTSFGATTQLAAATGIINGNQEGSIVSIFGVSSTTNTDIVSGGGVLDTSMILGNITDHPSGDQLDLIFALAELSGQATAGIETGLFIINVPAGFLVNSQSVSPSAGCDAGTSTSTLSATTFTDGSTQITCTVTDVGGGTNEAVVITIDTTAPNATADALYIVVALAEGITEAALEHPVGPLLEFPIQVLELP